MRKKDSQPWLIYINPKSIEHITDTKTPRQIGTVASISWPEMIQNIELGNKEFEVLLALSEKADLDISEIILLYLYHWEGKIEEELSKMYNIPRRTISWKLERARKKLYPVLKIALA